MGRILIIGDDLDIRQWLRAILESDGHDITGAEDELEAIDLHKIKSFDLIITDIMMPKKSGFEVIKELKTSDPDLPIIVVYGGGRFKTAAHAKIASDLGADHAMKKPIDQAQLKKTVNSYLAA